MPDPQSIHYETFGKMILDHSPYLIAGALALIGLTTMIWKKLGFLDFDKDKTASQCDDCEVLKRLEDGKDGDVGKCPAHEALHDQQVRMLAQQKVNTDALNNGKKQFRRLHDELTEVKVGIGILLDRTGGRVDGFKKE